MNGTLAALVTVQAPRGYGTATLSVRVDPVEHQRRQLVGLGGIGSPAVLDLLMQLPVGLPVPVGVLQDRDRRCLRRLQPGIVELTSGEVTRLAVKPTVVELATVEGRVNQRTIGLASGFAPFCSRAILTPVRPSAARLAEADFWGIGVILERDGVRETLFEPEPWRPMRHTVAGWLFTEQVYRAVLAA